MIDWSCRCPLAKSRRAGALCEGTRACGLSRGLFTRMVSHGLNQYLQHRSDIMHPVLHEGPSIERNNQKKQSSRDALHQISTLRMNF